MCIAIYSPKNNDLPSEAYLKASFISNPDGAGFAFNTDDGRVQIVKGLMKYKDFIRTFNEYDKKYNLKKRGVLIHFRITTHGGTNPECTHPFPLTSDPETLRKTTVTAEYAVIHNGIISLTSTEAYKAVKMSDTMVFIAKYLSRLASFNNWFEEAETFPLIYDLIDSKMAILRGDGEIKSTAGFTKDEDGNYYSNMTYKEERKKTYTTVNYKNYKWSDYVYDSYDTYDDGPYYSSKDDKVITPKSKAKSYYVPLMEVPKRTWISLDDGSDFYLDDEEGNPKYHYYVTQNGALYWGEPKYKESAETQRLWFDLEFLGYGELWDMYARPVIFNADHEIYKTFLKGGDEQ